MGFTSSSQGLVETSLGPASTAFESSGAPQGYMLAAVAGGWYLELSVLMESNPG